MRLFLFGILLAFMWLVVGIGLHSGIRNGGWLRERMDRLRTPQVKHGALGSSHFCTQREYRHFRRPHSDGLVLLGAFWGEGKRRLDFGSRQFCLSGENIVRGILTLVGPGSGKKQGIILPAIADRMLAGHSLVIADPQGEITAHVLKYATVTRHLVVVHDPTSKLDSLVADVNLVRKRRISILIGVQTKGQFHMIYGSEGTQALFIGLATQVVYGGCDADTAEFYSKASGTATTDANQDDPNSHLRQRPLLTVDEVITPQVGNCTIFARYVEAGFATQVILNARLTRFDERDDWEQQLTTEVNCEQLLLERGISLPTSPAASLDAAPQAGDALLEHAARSRLSAIERTMNLTIGSKVKLATVSELRARLKQHQQERTP